MLLCAVKEGSAHCGVLTSRVLYLCCLWCCPVGSKDCAVLTRESRVPVLLHADKQGSVHCCVLTRRTCCLCCCVLQAKADAERLNTLFEALAEAALADSSTADGQGASSAVSCCSEVAADTAAAEAGSSEDAASRAAQSKAELLRRAEAAEQVSHLWLLHSTYAMQSGLCHLGCQCYNAHAVHVNAIVSVVPLPACANSCLHVHPLERTKMLSLRVLFCVWWAPCVTVAGSQLRRSSG